MALSNEMRESLQSIRNMPEEEAYDLGRGRALESLNAISSDVELLAKSLLSLHQMIHRHFNEHRQSSILGGTIDGAPTPLPPIV